MKVAVLTTSSRKAGGLFYSVRWLSKALAAEGCQPEIFSPSDEYSQEDLGAWKPLPIRFYPAFGPTQASPALRKMLAGSGADLIHLHGIWMDNQWAAMRHQKKIGAPVVVSPRGMLDPWAVGNAAWKKKLVENLFARKALEQATCIHALCRSEVESIRAYGLENPVALIPNAVELPEIGLRNTKAGDRKKLLFLGRIHPKKGLSELLKAWAKAQSQKPEALSNWELLIAGWDDGGHEAGLRELAGDSVEFVGSKYGEEKERLLREVDAFVLPSFSEGLPMSVLEAWSFGLPVVMTDFCNLPEGFAAEAAIRVEPDTDSIFQGLEKLAAMPEGERADMGIRGRNLVEEKFTWPKVAKEMRQVYEWCLTGNNPPGCMEF
jgi:poly(glycerol-phosphate) alpha-glucosyltransferase